MLQGSAHFKHPAGGAYDRELIDNVRPPGWRNPRPRDPLPPARHRRRAGGAGRGARRRRARRDRCAHRARPARRRLPELRLHPVEAPDPHGTRLCGHAQRRQIRRLRSGRHPGRLRDGDGAHAADPGAPQSGRFGATPRRKRHRRVLRRRRVSSAAMPSTSTAPGCGSRRRSSPPARARCCRRFRGWPKPAT